MKHRIDPKIDCVFKALLGAERNRNLLVHFLNAMLGHDLAAPLTSVELLNPYNDQEFLDDKLSIVDVKARDSAGRFYQVEIQLLSYRSLPERILYSWTDLYSQQWRSGGHYRELRPTYAIWLVAETLLAHDQEALHVYQLRDAQGRALVEHGGIWLLELRKFNAHGIETDQQRWLKFFKDGEQLDDAHLPVWMQTPEMEQAMSTLRQFSEKDRDYLTYQARQNHLRQQRTLQYELNEALQREQAALADKEQERLEKEQERQAKLQALRDQERERQAKVQALQDQERERQEKEAALTEIARLRALLEQRDH